MVTDPVVLALRAALAASDSPALRAALGDQLLRAGTPAEALDEIEAGLQRFPASAPLLAAAVRAARATGDAARAAAYELALAASAPEKVSAARLHLVTDDEAAAVEAPALTFADVVSPRAPGASSAVAGRRA